MARFVIEPAVVVKWFVPETNSSPASRLLDGGNELTGPDTLLPAAGKLVTAKVQRKELTADEGAMVIEAAQTVPVSIYPSQPLLEPAMRIAAAFDLDFTDSIGLTVAVHSDCRLVTALRTLYDKIQGTPFAQHVKWVGDIR